MVYVFQYTYAGGLPSLGNLWTADPDGGGAHNLHLWAAPPFFADHAHTQEGLDFVRRSQDAGFRQAVRERDDPFGDYGSRPG